jgi:peroxiredoxin
VLRVGDIAPNIRAKTTNGTDFDLSEEECLCSVIYFFPKAFTPGCTAETKQFRDNFAELTLQGAQVVGVSTDSFDTQCRFVKETAAPFPLIADPDKSIARSYGVLYPLIGIARRITFIVAHDRRILSVISSLFDIEKHRDGVLSAVHGHLESLRRETGRS